MATDARVFISYRQQDTGAYSGWLHERLSDRFGTKNVFKDVAALRGGAEFPREISKAILSSTCLIALIGHLWNPVDNVTAKRRLSDETDWVRREIEAGLDAGLKVIPVLVDGARMPATEEVPESMRRLCERHAFSLSHTTFKTDVQSLIGLIEGSHETDSSMGGGPVSSDAGTLNRFKEIDQLLRAHTTKGGEAEKWRKVAEKIAATLDSDESVIQVFFAGVIDASTWEKPSAFLSSPSLVVVTNRRILHKERGLWQSLYFVSLRNIVAVSSKSGWVFTFIYVTLADQTVRFTFVDSPVAESFLRYLQR